MLIKVCGNIDEKALGLINTPIDLMGFIFYPKSKRYVNRKLLHELINEIPDSISKVGVYVNEPLEQIKKDVLTYKLDYVQLHGDEDPKYCWKLIDRVKVIKAFRIDGSFDFNQTEAYQFCDLLLFDAKGKDYGGNGIKYNWEILEKYQGNVSFLLAGGLKPEDANSLLQLKHPKFVGVDINSGFEIEPGIKNIKLVKQFSNEIKCSIK